MEEIFDICDENGVPTGQTVPRSVAHAEGIMHRTAHIWVVRENNGRHEVLLQKRSMEKESFPGGLDTSSAGHIQAGDEPLESAIRELSEELGIFAKPEDLKFIGTFHTHYEMEFHGKMFKDKELTFVYAYDKPVNREDLILQEEELEDADWFDFEETVINARNRDPRYAVPSRGLRVCGMYFGVDIDEICGDRTALRKDEYERRYSRFLPYIGDMMKEQLDAYPVSVATVLYAGNGTGLEHVSAEKYGSVYAVEASEELLADLGSKDGLSESVEIMELDVRESAFLMPYADLLIADLCFGEIGPAAFKECVEASEPQFVSIILPSSDTQLDAIRALMAELSFEEIGNLENNGLSQLDFEKSHED